MQDIREIFERHQVGIYFAAVVLAALVALLVPGTAALEGGVNPALALMLFVTFLQVPLADLGRAFSRGRFLAALLITNFIVTPLLVAVLVQFLPSDPMVRLGVLLVLLTPCIDYVVTFSHLGRADARLLLAATPALLVVQMLLLPVYLGLLLGNDAATLVQPGPFVLAPPHAAEPEVLLHGQLGHGRAALRHQGHAHPDDVLGLLAGDLHAVEGRRSGHGLHEPGQRAHQRGLARAVGPDQTGHPLADLHAEVVERSNLRRAVAHPERLCLDHPHAVDSRPGGRG